MEAGRKKETHGCIRNAWRKTLETFFVLAILAIGGYPPVSNAWNQLLAERMIVRYQKSLWEDGRQSVSEQIRKKAEACNQRLAEAGGGLMSVETEDYEQQLDPDGSGVMGYLEIPEISVFLPICHGTDDAVLAKGVGHLEGSSLPIGGKGTHTVLTGHRGLPSATLFSDLDQLQEQDHFRILVLGETLEYAVTEIQTVLPEETGKLRIEAGRDLATLVTCTPYGVNTHRLLVTGERISDRSDASDTEEAGKSHGEKQSTDKAVVSRNAATKTDGTQRRATGRAVCILAGAGAILLAAGFRIVWIWCIDRKRQMQKEQIRSRRAAKRCRGKEAE